MTVRDFVECACNPKKINILVCDRDYTVFDINENDRPDGQMLDWLGDFVVEDFKANKPDEYAVWVQMRPVKVGEVG